MAKLAMSTVKSKGRQTENSFVKYMKDKWFKVVERRRLTGSEDQGDITGWDNVCVEIKSATGQTINLNEWLRQLEAEKKNSGAEHAFIACRPRGKPNAEDWYAVMPLPDLMQMFQDLDILLPDQNGSGDWDPLLMDASK